MRSGSIKLSILFPDLVGNGYFCIVYPALCRILAKFSYMKLLIIDDNAAVRATLKIVLGRDYEVTAVGDPKLIPALINGGRFDVVLLDMNFDNAKLDCSDGLFWLERIKGSDKAPAVVVITAFGDVDVAVKAMKLGAEDFVTKPWDNAVLSEKLRNAIATNIKRRNEEAAAKRTREVEDALHERDNLTLDEVKVRHIRSVIERCGGNLSAAAEQLGVNRQTLYNILKKMQ